MTLHRPPGPGTGWWEEAPAEQVPSAMPSEVLLNHCCAAGLRGGSRQEPEITGAESRAGSRAEGGGSGVREASVGIWLWLSRSLPPGLRSAQAQGGPS